MINLTGTSVGRTLAAFFIAATVNACIFLMLASLNRAGSSQRNPRPDYPAPIRLMKLDQPRAPEVSLLKEALPEPEIMTVRIEPLVPRKVELEPVEFNLSIPEVSAYPVPVIAVSSEPSAAKHAVIVAGRKSCQSTGLPRLASRVDEPPEELDGLSPRYPRDALMRGIRGGVLMKLLISEHGRVEDIRILRVEGPAAFRAAVLEVAWKWRFRPARHCGRPVKVWGVKQVRFELEE